MGLFLESLVCSGVGLCFWKIVGMFEWLAAFREGCGVVDKCGYGYSVVDLEGKKQ